MSSPLLPMWAQVVSAAALFAVVGLHLWHASSMRGQARWWHSGHVAMAAGMIVMYFPPAMMSGWFRAVKQPCLAVFSAAAVALVVTTLTVWVRERSPNPLWMLATLDMMAMAYMWLPHDLRPPALTWVIIGYFGLETAAWLTGAMGRLPAYRTVVVAGPPAPVISAGTASGERTATLTEPATVIIQEHKHGLNGHITIGARITLAIMSASMAYMFLVML